MSRNVWSGWRWARAGAVAAMIAGAAAAAGCGEAERPAEADGGPPSVEIGRENVVTVATEEISVGPLVSGELRAAREATVRAEIGGSVLQVGPEEGQAVRRGALLARIETRTLEESYQSSQSRLNSAEQALQVAERELARTERLVKGGALAERELESARNAVAAARAQRADALAGVASAKRLLADATVRSPMPGIVARRHVGAGDVVTPGRELYTIIDPSSMRLEASVPSEQLSAVQVGATVTFQVRGYPGQTFEGKIERISPTADPVTRQVPIFVTIPNTGGQLLAGLFAEGRVLQESRRALVVPARAVSGPEGGAWALRVRQGQAERVDVTLGLRDPETERVEILAGLEEGDLVLVGAAQGMTPGTPVTIRKSGAQGD